MSTTPADASEAQEERVLKSGVSIDHFTITSLLSSGLCGAVFAAKCAKPDHPAPGKGYTLKAMYIYGGSTSITAMRNEFEAEFKLLSKLEPHPWCEPLLPRFRMFL